ncbi:MAG: hypothetical protein KME57_27895 [Scytonema hyalinum WJT4-NPBG1]|jgi:hypothetical protein|nr:hypothetical protein [Scytonema hyalinum WJT4-NPBG1]
MAQLRRLAEGVQSRLEVTLMGVICHKFYAEAWKYRHLQLDEVQPVKFNNRFASCHCTSVSN